MRALDLVKIGITGAGAGWIVIVGVGLPLILLTESPAGMIFGAVLWVAGMALALAGIIADMWGSV